jgi:hypothetical protein
MTQAAARSANKYVLEDDSSSEEEVRVVLSAKAKEVQAMEKACQTMISSAKNSDWGKISTGGPLFRYLFALSGSFANFSGVGGACFRV